MGVSNEWRQVFTLCICWLKNIENSHVEDSQWQSRDIYDCYYGGDIKIELSLKTKFLESIYADEIKLAEIKGLQEHRVNFIDV